MLDQSPVELFALLVCMDHQALARNPDALHDLQQLVGLSAEEAREQLTSYFQALSEQVAQGFSRGMFRLIRSLAMRHVWSEYGLPEEVKMATFLTALESYLADQLRLGHDDIATLLSAANKDAIATCLDRDGDGKV